METLKVLLATASMDANHYSDAAWVPHKVFLARAEYRLKNLNMPDAGICGA
jgi:hypothetical protein